MNKLFRWVMCVGISICVSVATRVYGYDDGFGSAKKIAGKHFTIFYAPTIDLTDLAMRFDVQGASAFNGIYTGTTAFPDMVDGLFERVCTILDMQLYSYEGTIKVCRDSVQLNSIFEGIFGRPVPSSSFYINELNTIYVDQEHFTQWVIGHEMGHAIQCHYFVVSPPEKVQEILSGYVEYQLRKTAK